MLLETHEAGPERERRQVQPLLLDVGVGHRVLGVAADQLARVDPVDRGDHLRVRPIVSRNWDSSGGTVIGLYFAPAPSTIVSRFSRVT